MATRKTSLGPSMAKMIAANDRNVKRMRATSGLLMYLQRGDVAGVTFTRADPLTAMMRKPAVDTTTAV